MQAQYINASIGRQSASNVFLIIFDNQENRQLQAADTAYRGDNEYSGIHRSLERRQQFLISTAGQALERGIVTFS